MAIVANLDGGKVSGADRFVDKPLTTYNRENAGTPNGSLTPEFVGEVVLDTTNARLWQAQDLSNNSWVDVLRAV